METLKKFSVLLEYTLIANFVTAQTATTGKLDGILYDADQKTPIKSATIYLKKLGIIQQQNTTNDSGYFVFNLINAGQYNLEVSNKQHFPIKVNITNGKTTHQNIIVLNTALDVVMVKAKKKLVEPTVPVAMPQRNVNMIANTIAGIDARAGGTPNIRGARADGTAYYIDGVRVSSSNTGSVPNNTVSVTSYEPNFEKYSAIKENTFKSVLSDPVSTFSVDVDRASYANVRRYLTSNSLPPADAVRIEELINYFPLDIKQKDSIHPFVVRTELTNAPWNEANKILQIVLKAPEIDLEQAKPSNLTFLIDVSGSMSSPDKLPLLKECLRMLTKNLRSQDKVAMVVYAGNSGLVLNMTAGTQQHKILSSIANLESGGSTAGGEGIQLAYKIARANFNPNANNRIILATDGDFNVGITSTPELVKLIEAERESGVFLSVLGFGVGNLNDELMENLADKGNGNYNYIDNILEGKKVLVNEIGGTLYTVAKDVKLQLEFNPKYITSYRLIGYENRLLNKEDFNNDAKDAGDIGAGHCVTALYELVTTSTDSTAKNPDNMRYQNFVLTNEGRGMEWANIKIRYKLPNQKSSILMEQPVVGENVTHEYVSDNLRFTLAIAMFGMKLRNAEYTQKIPYQTIINWSKAAKGIDNDGYRAEFIKLIETAELLANK